MTSGRPPASRTRFSLEAFALSAIVSDGLSGMIQPDERVLAPGLDDDLCAIVLAGTTRSNVGRASSIGPIATLRSRMLTMLAASLRPQLSL